MGGGDLRGVDLNLLVALEALLTERHITRAGRHINLSQPSMSRALARLRELFGDPLLVSTAEGLRPTSRAEELEAPLRNILAQVVDLLSHSGFDPARASGEIRIAAPDIIAYKLLPDVLREMRRRAPELALTILQWSPNWREQLEGGDLSLTIGQPTGNEPGIYQHVLVTTEWVCVLREGHPCLDQPWTRQLYSELPHLMITVSGHGPGQVDDALARHGLTRHVALRMPYTVLSPLVIAESDLVLTTSRWLATKLARQLPLVLREPPVELAPMPLPMVWHERTHREEKARWVRELFIQAGKAIDPAMLRANPGRTPTD
jgi:DNA-binding transcriptional LysR family regulator